MTGTHRAQPEPAEPSRPAARGRRKAGKQRSGQSTVPVPGGSNPGGSNPAPLPGAVSPQSADQALLTQVETKDHICKIFGPSDPWPASLYDKAFHRQIYTLVS